MQNLIDTPVSRRGLLGAGLLSGLALAGSGKAMAVGFAPPLLSPELRSRALAAMSRHIGSIANRDIIGIADFDQASSTPRFHLLETASGRVTSLLVAHGRGSDPSHTGWLQRFSNDMGSAASCQGAFVTGETYVGNHGLSRRIDGLDPTNSNARDRAVVIHGAWYVSPEMARDHGKLGRSEGCFAFSENDLPQVLARLGPGRLIYSDKVDRA